MLTLEILMDALLGPELRRQANPTGTHKHKCPSPNCKHVWEHSDSKWGDEEAHQCPLCRTEQWTKHNR